MFSSFSSLRILRPEASTSSEEKEVIITSKDKPCQFCRGWAVSANPEEYASWDRAWNFKIDRILRNQLKCGQCLRLPITKLVAFYKFLTRGKTQCSFCDGNGLARMFSRRISSNNPS